MTPAEVVATYGAAWGEADEDKRRALLEQAWAENGTYLDPSGRADGREALVAHIGGFRQTFAGHEITMASGVDSHDRFVRFAWTMVDASGATIMEASTSGNSTATASSCRSSGSSDRGRS